MREDKERIEDELLRYKTEDPHSPGFDRQPKSSTAVLHATDEIAGADHIAREKNKLVTLHARPFEIDLTVLETFIEGMIEDTCAALSSC